jgi:amino-acid N-acetyltransferase
MNGVPTIVAETIAAGHWAEFQALLAAAGLPAAESGPAAVYRRYRTQVGRTVGFGGVAGSGPDRLLRSIVVAPDFRRRGFGAGLVRDLEHVAAGGGATRLHLLTTTAAAFFERLGWEPRERMTAPVAIAITTEFSVLCPARARYLVKRIAGGI